MNITRRAKRGDRSALNDMFRQFLPPDEVIYDVQYLGQRGFLGLGTHSFAAVTDRRVASLLVSMFGRVQYRDGYHEDINSSVVVQPSRAHETGAVLLAAVAWISVLWIIVMPAPNIVLLALWIAAWVTAAITLSPAIARVLYRMSKSGLLLSVREGISVYCFTDRSRLGLANHLASVATMARERRIPQRPLGPSDDLISPGASNAAPSERRTAASFTWTPERHGMVFGIAFTSVALLRAIAAPAWPPVVTTARSSPWAPTLLQLLAPSLAAYLVGVLLVFARGPRIRALALGSMLGIGLAIGLQSTMAMAYALDVKASATSAAVGDVTVTIGYWLVQALGFALATVAIAGWATSDHDTRELLNDSEPNIAATGWMAIGSFAVLVGSLAPWVSSRTDHFWGLQSAHYKDGRVGPGMWLVATFLVGTSIAVAAPLVSLALRRRWSSTGLLSGWLLVVAIMVGAVEVDRPYAFAIGFRLVEVGAVLGLAGAISAIVASPLRRSVTEHAARLAPWPPPAAAHAD